MYFLITIAFLFIIRIIYTRFKNKFKKVLIVEGNIGTGKTTFLKLLENSKKIEIIYEPVDVWTHIVDTDGKNILEKFYGDFKRWAYTMQSFAFKTRLEAQSNPQIKPLRIIERSVFTDYFVFAHNCFLNDLMTKLEWLIYKSWFKSLLKVYQKAGYKINPDGYIYLKCTPQTAFDRIKKRNRNGESEISLEYLQQIDKLHDSWLYSENNKIPVLTIDCDKDFENNIEYQIEIFQKLSNFI